MQVTITFWLYEEQRFLLRDLVSVVNRVLPEISVDSRVEHVRANGRGRTDKLIAPFSSRAQAYESLLWAFEHDIGLEVDPQFPTRRPIEVPNLEALV